MACPTSLSGVVSSPGFVIAHRVRSRWRCDPEERRTLLEVSVLEPADAGRPM
jgi:hypothetical protein